MQADRSRSPARRDAAFLVAAVIASLAWYVPHLGFYSDDWAALGNYATSADQTLGGLFRATNGPMHAMRPVQVGLWAVLYRLFGTDPTGYHLFNGVLLAANAVLLHAVLRDVGVARVMAVAVPLVYALLPSYTTSRLWYVAFAITLSITALLTSIHANLRAVTAPAMQRIAWKTLAAVGLVVSTLAYEVALPLFVVAPVLMIWRLWQHDGGLTRRRVAMAAILVAVDAVLLAGVIVFKLETTVRLGAREGLGAQVVDILQNAVRLYPPYGAPGLNVFSAVRLHFRDYGVKLPVVAAELGRLADPVVIVLTGAFALFAFVWLARAVRKEPWPSRRAWSLLTGAGLIVFALGYAIFLTTYAIGFSPTGITNRTANAAALGAAMSITGVIGWMVTWLRETRAVRWAFAGAIAVVVGSGFLIINVVADHWVRAYATELRVLDAIQERFPSLPSGSTLILDGVCPYVGPAVVFESSWDLAGALQLRYRDSTLAADVVTPRLVVGADGITTTIYDESTRYPYGERLIVYDAARGVAQALANEADARAYFAESSGARACPPGRPGFGVRLF